jgi:hypothetical protein
MMILEQDGIAWHMSMMSLHATGLNYHDATYSIPGLPCNRHMQELTIERAT